MRSLAIIGGLAALFLLDAALPASAAPWCLIEGRDGFENCGFHSEAQCRAAASGLAAYCLPNPQESVGQAPPYGSEPRGKRRPPRRYMPD